ncbi:MAG TPA: hypothetical protein VHT91_12200, partial [Kofleriaceae bacterium]|nr:hypothetical protein [Kofleriaceae bacterium]
AGTIYVADRNNSTVRKLTAAGAVTTLAGTAGMTGSVDGTGAAARFNSPAGVAVDSAGNVYVADSGNSTLRKVTLTGTTTTIAGTPGAASIALGATPRFGFPQGLAIVVDSLLVSDANAILLLANGAR